MHLKGGYRAFWYSSMGLIFVPILIGITLDGIANKFTKRKSLVNSIIYCIASIIIIINILSVSELFTRRSYIKEIASFLGKYQNEVGARVYTINYNPPILYYFDKNRIIYQKINNLYEINNDKTPANNIVVVSYEDDPQLKKYFKNKSYCEYKGWGETYYLIMNGKCPGFFLSKNNIFNRFLKAWR